MSALVTTRDGSNEKFILLQPGEHLPRLGTTFNVIAWTEQEVIQCLNSAILSEVVAVDLETRGGDYSDNIEIVGVGLSWDTGNCYIPWTMNLEPTRSIVRSFLLSHPRILAHNIYFDGGVLLKELGKHPDWHICTYAALAMTANEGYPGQGWGLKRAQTTLLGWSSSNEGELDEWLVLNGYYKGVRRLDNSEEYLRAEYLSGGLKPEKAEMWRAPVEILGKYCILDAESTYLLYTEVLRPVLERFPALDSMCRGEFLHLIKQLIEQKMYGIEVDREGLQSRLTDIEAGMQQLVAQFRDHKLINNHIISIETDRIYKGIQCKEPGKIRKNGGISKNWLKWEERMKQAYAGQLPDYVFNMNSDKQLRHLLYDKLGFEQRVFTEKNEPATGIKALKSMGEIGSLLIEYNYLQKEQGYVQDYLARTEHRSTIHPSFRTPGTMTGRLSSKEPNLQQVPKTHAVMSRFHSRPGTVWVDLDFSALEPVVATEFSQDPNMLRIYGDGMPPNDLYLYVGAHIPDIGERIRATGYDPLRPTQETLARARKECKRDRSICKTVALACQYGAGVNKVMQTLENDNIYLSYDEVEQIHSGYWSLFSKVRDFSKALFYEWKRNRGYILNGMGRPMCVPEDSNKDLLNRFIQSTGHDILVRYIYILTHELTRREIPYKPLIIDLHDATTVEVPEEYVNITVDTFEDSMVELNRQLQGTVTLRGTPTVGTTLADVKEPEE